MWGKKKQRDGWVSDRLVWHLASTTISADYSAGNTSPHGNRILSFLLVFGIVFVLLILIFWQGG